MLSKGAVMNFETLKKAFANGDVCLMECYDTKEKAVVSVICAVQRSGDDIEMVPFAKLFSENPYEVLLPPDPKIKDGFVEADALDAQCAFGDTDLASATITKVKGGAA